MQTSKPALELLTSDAIYRENPTALFHQLCGARPATLLLESADIDSKDDFKKPAAGGQRAAHHRSW